MGRRCIYFCDDCSKRSFINVVERCKQYALIVVAGGPYPTSSCEEITGVDHFVLGEAEISLQIFCWIWKTELPQQNIRQKTVLI
jgi:Fe-S oxidoreductase